MYMGRKFVSRGSNNKELISRGYYIYTNYGGQKKCSEAMKLSEDKADDPLCGLSYKEEDGSLVYLVR